MIETTRCGRALVRLMTLTVALAALLSGEAEAGLDEWTSQGPFGGSIWTLAIDPQVRVGNGNGAAFAGFRGDPILQPRQLGAAGQGA